MTGDSCWYFTLLTSFDHHAGSICAPLSRRTWLTSVFLLHQAMHASVLGLHLEHFMCVNFMRSGEYCSSGKCRVIHVDMWLISQALIIELVAFVHHCMWVGVELLDWQVFLFYIRHCMIMLILIRCGIGRPDWHGTSWLESLEGYIHTYVLESQHWNIEPYIAFTCMRSGVCRKFKNVAWASH